MCINEFYKYMLFLSLLSCNMSDYNEEIQMAINIILNQVINV